MTQGVPTPLEAREAFRAHYLYSGNAAESARAAGINERTGRDIARDLLDDAEFTEARRKLRAQEVDECIAARRRVREVALERFESKDGGIDVKQFGGEDAPVTIIDKRAEYGKLVLDAEKNAHNLARFDAEKDGSVAPAREVTIKVVPMKPTDDEGEGSNGGS